MNFRAEVRAKARNKRKGRKNLTLSGRLKNVFCGKQFGLDQEETLVVFYPRMPRETVRTTWNEVWRYARNSHLEQAYPSVPKVKKQTDGKSLNSLKASPETRAQNNSLSMVGKMKKIVAQLSTSSRVSWLQVSKQMHSWLSLPMCDMLKVRSNLRSEVEKRRYSRISCHSEGKKSKVVYLKTQIQ